MYNAFEQDNTLYIILEYIKDGTLFEYVQKNKLTEKDAAVAFYQITDAVAYLHKHKILHRDIKPENVLRENEADYKLCDFGFSAPYGDNVLR